jgi:hypothetical protein
VWQRRGIDTSRSPSYLIFWPSFFLMKFDTAGARSHFLLSSMFCRAQCIADWIYIYGRCASHLHLELYPSYCSSMSNGGEVEDGKVLSQKEGGGGAQVISYKGGREDVVVAYILNSQKNCITFFNRHIL